jgi:hypothetical protein
MKTFLYAVFLMLSVQLNAQVAYYSDEVKAKMDQNKIDGVPTLTGIEFDHKVVILSGLSDAIYKNNDSKIQESLNEIKNGLGFLHVDFERLTTGDLIINFIDDIEYPIDSIKIALTNKNFISSAIEVIAILDK